MLSWQQHDGCQYVSLVMSNAGAKFEEHCFNIPELFSIQCCAVLVEPPTVRRHYFHHLQNTKMWKQKKILQKGKCNSSLLWKAFQISIGTLNQVILLHHHLNSYSRRIVPTNNLLTSLGEAGAFPSPVFLASWQCRSYSFFDWSFSQIQHLWSWLRSHLILLRILGVKFSKNFFPCLWVSHACQRFASRNKDFLACWNLLSVGLVLEPCCRDTTTIWKFAYKITLQTRHFLMRHGLAIEF